MPPSLRHRNISWDNGLAIEAKLFEEVRSKLTPAHLLFFEPKPTFTGGLSAKDSDVLWNSKELAHQNIALRRADRGGGWTYHGPGQVIVFPILDLHRIGFDTRAAKQFAEWLRETIRSCLSDYGVATHTKGPTFGLYVGKKKLASFGMRIRSGISQHGVSIYLTDPSPMMEGIIPCATAGATFTSVADCSGEEDWNLWTDRIENALQRDLGLRIKDE